MAFRNPWKSLKVRVTVVTSVVWLVGLWVLTLTVSAWLRQDLQRLLGDNQLSTAAIVGEQISQEIRDRMAALEAVAGTIPIPDLLDVDQMQRLLQGRPALGVLFNAGYFLTDAEGVATASFPLSAGRRGINYLYRNHVRTALQEGRPAVSEVAVGAALQVPVVSIAVPVRDSQGRVVGSLVGVTDLTKANFLNNSTQTKQGDSGGYLLVSRGQRLIVTATDQRRIMEKLAGPGVNPEIDRFLDGWEGVQVLVNPLGVEVLVAVHQIPLADWYVAVAAPTAEVFAPVRELQNRMLLTAALLTLLTGLINWFLLKRQLNPVVTAIATLSQLTEAKLPPRPLPVARRDEIGTLIEGFNRLLLDLEKRETERARYEALLSQNQRLESLGLLAGGIAHDFNNLLASIYGNLELAKLQAPESPAAPALDRTLATVDRARSLTRQLLTFAKGGEPELKAESLFPWVAETVQFALSGSAHQCRFDVEDGLWACRYDRNQLGQVIDNLIINARQAMPQGGTVTVTARNRGTSDRREVELSVADTGIGIPAELLEHVFDPFFTTKTDGHGLGLATSHSIVRKHGGTLEAASEPGKGAVFTIHLPAVEPEAAETTGPTEGAPPRQGTLLVMDDDDDIRQLLETILVTAGYRVVSVRSGEEALATFLEAKKSGAEFSAALLDLTVRGAMGGQETLNQLRSHGATFPAFVVSGYSEAAVLSHPQVSGFAGALRKPFLADELLQLLAHTPRG